MHLCSATCHNTSVSPENGTVLVEIGWQFRHCGWSPNESLCVSVGARQVNGSSAETIAHTSEEHAEYEAGLYEREAGACDYFQVPEASQAGPGAAMIGGASVAALLILLVLALVVYKIRAPYEGAVDKKYDDPALVIAKIRAAGGSLSMDNPAYDPTPGSGNVGSLMTMDEDAWNEGGTMVFGDSPVRRAKPAAKSAKSAKSARSGKKATATLPVEALAARAMQNPLYAEPGGTSPSFGLVGGAAGGGFARTASSLSFKRASWMTPSSEMAPAPDDDDDFGYAELGYKPDLDAGGYVDVQPDPGSEYNNSDSDDGNFNGFGNEFDSDDGDPDLYGELSPTPPLPQRNTSTQKAESAAKKAKSKKAKVSKKSNC